MKASASATGSRKTRISSPCNVSTHSHHTPCREMTSHFWIAVSFAEVGEAGEGGEGALHRVRLELVDRQRLLQVQPRRSLHLLGPFHPVPVGLLEHRLRDE